MAFYLSPIVNSPQIGLTGAPLSGGSITTYQAGTSTPVATYTDSSGVTPQPNPITLNPYGLPASPVWQAAGQAIKFVIKDAAGNTVRTVDGVLGINDFGGAGLVINGAAYTVPQTVAFSTTPTFDASKSNVFEFGALTANVTSVTIINGSNGQTINLRFVQDATGGRTVSLPASFRAAGSVQSGANTKSWLVLTYVASLASWEGTWTSIP